MVLYNYMHEFEYRESQDVIIIICYHHYLLQEILLATMNNLDHLQMCGTQYSFPCQQNVLSGRHYSDNELLKF